MTGNYDDEYSMLPTVLDRERLNALRVDRRMEAENGTWVVCRYPAKPSDWRSCEYLLMVNNPQLPQRGSPFEFKNLKALLTFLAQLDGERVKGRED